MHSSVPDECKPVIFEAGEAAATSYTGEYIKVFNVSNLFGDRYGPRITDFLKSPAILIKWTGLAPGKFP